MRIPIIKVRYGDYTHIVGTNSHDKLIIDNNAIHYLDLQGMVGTRFGEMRFEGVEPDEWSMTGEVEVEMVSIEELIEIAIKQCDEYAEQKQRFHELFEMLKNKREETIEKTKEFGWDSSGVLMG